MVKFWESREFKKDLKFLTEKYAHDIKKEIYEEIIKKMPLNKMGKELLKEICEIGKKDWCKKKYKEIFGKELFESEQ